MDDDSDSDSDGDTPLSKKCEKKRERMGYLNLNKMIKNNHGITLLNIAARRRRTREILNQLGHNFPSKTIQDIDEIDMANPMYAFIMIESYVVTQKGKLKSGIKELFWGIVAKAIMEGGCRAVTEALTYVFSEIEGRSQRQQIKKMKEMMIEECDRHLLKDEYKRKRMWCEQYHMHGWCSEKSKCTKSHICMDCGKAHPLYKCRAGDVDEKCAWKQDTMVNRWVKNGKNKKYDKYNNGYDNDRYNKGGRGGYNDNDRYDKKYGNDRYDNKYDKYKRK